RIGGHHNFYDALLLQDGHELIRIKPPRDLESWQKLPVSEIARTRPVILPDLERATIQRYLDSYPYARFPVISGGEILGIANRQELKSSLASDVAPRLTPPVFCASNMSVREVGARLMESASGMVLVRQDSTGDIMA